MVRLVAAVAGAGVADAILICLVPQLPTLVTLLIWIFIMSSLALLEGALLIQGKLSGSRLPMDCIKGNIDGTLHSLYAAFHLRIPRDIERWKFVIPTLQIEKRGTERLM